MTTPARVLIVEDRPEDAGLMEREVRRSGIDCVTRRVETEVAFVHALHDFVPDIILSDHSLPQFGAREVLRLCREVAPSVPIIVVTGSLDEETAADYIKEGATDYIVKHHLERLGPAVVRARALSSAQADQHRAQEELRASEHRLRAILDTALDAVVTIDADGLVSGWNRQAVAVFGWTSEEAVGRSLEALIVPDELRDAHRQGLERFRSTTSGPVLNRRIEMPALRRDGRRIPVELAIVPILLSEHWTFTAFIRDLSEQRDAEASHRAMETRLAQVVRASSAVIYTMKLGYAGFRPTWVSENVARLTGYSREQALEPDWWLTHLHPDDRARVEEEVARIRDRGEFTCEYRFQFLDGSYHWILDEARLSEAADGHAGEVVGTWFDTTERRNLEMQLRHAQRMEAIGQLAGGIAHDFNNVLTVIAGNADLLQAEIPAGDPRRQDVEDIQAATTRAASLTRQLLAFSRRQVLQPQVLDLRAAVAGMERMLKRLIGEDVELICEIGSDTGEVEADPGQIEQVLLNLVVNARDAMPDGGSITIEMANVDLDAGFARAHPPATEGQYVQLMVSDTGTGMTSAVRERVFEPFFTTKESGRGTGLGLATVYGIVKQSGGFIWVYSEPGQGATFKIYLPRVTGSGQRQPRTTPPGMPRGGSETILLVEDEAAVRRVTKAILEQLGYRVLEAGHPAEAVTISDLEGESIHMVLTDMVMPGMNGPELVKLLLRRRPALKVLYASGYSGSAMQYRGLLTPGIAFLPKPFTRTGLASKVRDVLDDPAE